jgi:hypothetical protein
MLASCCCCVSWLFFSLCRIPACLLCCLVSFSAEFMFAFTVVEGWAALFGTTLSLLLTCLPCCLVSLSEKSLLGIAVVAGCATIMQSCCWVCYFWCSSASWFYSWWLGFGFRTLACSFDILVRLLASAGWVLA